MGQTVWFYVAFMAVVVMIVLTVWAALVLEAGEQPPGRGQEAARPGGHIRRGGRSGTESRVSVLHSSSIASAGRVHAHRLARKHGRVPGPFSLDEVMRMTAPARPPGRSSWGRTAICRMISTLRQVNAELLHAHEAMARPVGAPQPRPNMDTAGTSAATPARRDSIPPRRPAATAEGGKPAA
jgi:hypothetical protein